MNPSNNTTKKETYGFNTTQPSPSVAETKDFENALYEFVKNVRFKQTRNSTLQSTLNENMRKFDRSNNLFIAADKTSNYYEVSKDDHDRMLLKSVTNDYKKCDKKVVVNVNKGDKQIAESLELEDRVYAFAERVAFVTIKYHNENYQHNTKCRPINQVILVRSAKKNSC